MDRAAAEMIEWSGATMPDVTPEGWTRKFAEEAAEFLGIGIDLSGWSMDLVDPREARDLALVLVAFSRSIGGDLGQEMLDKMEVNRSRPQVRQPDGTYHHAKS